MELTITKVSTFEVIPERFKGEDIPPKFIFRTPNTVDVTNFLYNGMTIHELVFSCFERFENKITLKDEKGKEINYTTYKELIEMGLNPALTDIHTDCVLEMSKQVTNEREKAQTTEKKSVSRGKSTKQAK